LKIEVLKICWQLKNSLSVPIPGPNGIPEDNMNRKIVTSPDDAESIPESPGPPERRSIPHDQPAREAAA
jgi:hypothetical protein